MLFDIIKQLQSKSVTIDSVTAQIKANGLSDVISTRYGELLHILNCDLVELFNKKSINLAYYGLRQFPIGLFDLTNLEVLEANGNYLTEITKDFNKLINLVELNLDFNLITTS